MSSRVETLDALVELGPQGIAHFEESLDPSWIEAALEATNSASIRRRKLPAQQAVWLVTVATQSTCSLSMRADLKYELISPLPDGTILAKLHPTPVVRRKNPDIRESITVRIIEYRASSAPRSMS